MKINILFLTFTLKSKLFLHGFKIQNKINFTNISPRYKSKFKSRQRLSVEINISVFTLLQSSLRNIKKLLDKNNMNFSFSLFFM